MRLGVVVPSRGLIHSRTIAAILREANSTGWAWDLFTAHGRPIPGCFNEPATEALEWGADRVWIVEEDMHLPHGVLAELMAAADAGHGFAAADYPVTPAGTLAAVRDDHGAALWTGTGCMLATAAALAAALPFSTEWQYTNRGRGWAREPAAPGSYGLHDVELGMRLHTAGTPVHVVPTLCNQYRVHREADPGSNDHGWHDIRFINHSQPSQEDTP